MRNMYRVAMVSVVAVLLTTGALAADKKEVSWDDYKGIAKKAPIVTTGYGVELRLTMGLMKGQRMGFLFHPMTTCGEVFRGWLRNCAELIESGDDARYLNIGDNVLKEAKAKLESLVGASNSDFLNTRYRDLYLTKVSFPEDLKALAASPLAMHLPFLSVDHNDASQMLNIRVTLEKLAVHGKYANFELSDFYHTQMSPGLFSDDDVDLAYDAFVAYGVLRAKDRGIDIEGMDTNTGQQYVIRYGVGYCCNKTTRKCVLGTSSQSCNMCGLYCCPGATNCP